MQNKYFNNIQRQHAFTVFFNGPKDKLKHITLFRTLVK